VITIVSKNRAWERIMHIEAKIIARWVNVQAGLWPAASTPRVFIVPQGREDKEMTTPDKLGRLQGILDIYADIPKNLEVVELSVKDYIKQLPNRGQAELADIFKDDLAAVKAAMEALKPTPKPQPKKAKKPEKEAEDDAEA